MPPSRRAGLVVLLLAASQATRCEPDPVVPRLDRAIIDKARAGGEGHEPESGECVEKRPFYRDADGDGYGDPKKPVKACEAPHGFVANRDDCYDANRRAHPGQRDYYAVDRGDGSFDYDCDGRATRRFTTRAYCREKEEGGCAHASGWAQRKIPRCGEPAEFAWKVCREQVIVKPPEEGSDAGVSTQSKGALVPGAEQKKIYRCGGRKLPWKKRQLCR
jgi:hypothetical protein